MGFSESLGSRQQPTGPNARKVAKFEPGVGSPESEPTSIIFNGLSSAAWANFPPHGLENPPFLAENAKFIKDLWSAGVGLAAHYVLGIQGLREKNERPSIMARHS